MYLYKIEMKEKTLKFLDANSSLLEYFGEEDTPFTIYLTNTNKYTTKEFSDLIFKIINNYKLLIALTTLQFSENSESFIYYYDRSVKRYQENIEFKTFKRVFKHYWLVILDILNEEYNFKNLNETECIEFEGS